MQDPIQSFMSYRGAILKMDRKCSNYDPFAPWIRNSRVVFIGVKCGAQLWCVVPTSMQ